MDELGFLIYRRCYGIRIEGEVRPQIRLTVYDAAVHERSRLGDQAYDLVQRIIGLSRYSEHLVSGTQIAEERHGQRMSSAYQLRAHQRILSAEYIRIYRLQDIPAHVIISVSRRPDKARLAHMVFLKCRQHLELVVFADLLYMSKLRGQRRLRLPAQLDDAGI